MATSSWKPGAKNFIWVSYEGGKDPSTWPIIYFVPICINRKLGQKHNGYEVPFWCEKGNLTCCTTTLVPILLTWEAERASIYQFITHMLTTTRAEATKGKNEEFNPSLWYGWQGPSSLNHHHRLPGYALAGRWNWEWSQVYSQTNVDVNFQAVA